MKLYHGTNIDFEKIDIDKSKPCLIKILVGVFICLQIFNDYTEEWEYLLKK